jgi:hypothetical protein
MAVGKYSRSVGGIPSRAYQTSGLSMMGDPLDAIQAIGAYTLSNRLSLSPLNFQHTGPKDSG